MKIRKPKNKLRRLFCKHDYKWFKQVTSLQSLRGETRIQLCTKCGKEKSRYLAEFEGGGFK